VVEHPGDVADVFQERLENILVGGSPGEVADRLFALGPEVLVRFVAARDADQVEVTGQRAIVGEVVEGRQQFAPGQVAARSEDDQRGGRYRQALQTGGERILALGLGSCGTGRDSHAHRPLRRLARPAWAPSRDANDDGWLAASALRAGSSLTPRS